MVYIFYKQSEFVRMLVIAILGAILGFITYEIIYYLNPLSPKATISWTIAFLVGVIRQHALHRHFTFLNKAPYFKSLYKAYIVDLGVLIFSSALNWFLIETLYLNHRLTWLICLLLSSLISMIFLRNYIFKKPIK
ncbi:GtrA family protein [uncultured Winogradskyella sp.]|uniref:GtrA family protein n=1 Tax=uncultured Winogradskyella sp. TaxID=395353 RepID=UPI0026350CDC|nr:GtrA family protein [uncultured Winogradskyella sp.]